MTRWNRPGIRRRVLADMRVISGTLRVMISRWDCGGTIKDSLLSDTRPRRLDELPENDRDAWMKLAADCRQQIGRLEDLRSYAWERVGAIDRGEEFDHVDR